MKDTNNMTTELPEWVNKFDTYLELQNPGGPSKPSIYVKLFLDNLKLASEGKINPIQGMNRFIKNIKLFFTDFEEKHLKNKDINCEAMPYPKVMKKIWELQYTATLRAQEFESDTIDIGYICSLLRVPSNNDEDLKQKIIKITQDNNLLTEHYKRIQKEIMNTASVLKPTKNLTM